jgi:hypothetical protein
MKTKLFTLSLLTLAFSSGVHAAELPAPTTQVEPSPAKPVSVAASAKPATLEVNPFTGKPLTYEQMQADLEAAKLRTQALEEALKQSNLTEELKAVPLRKAVEMEQARTAVKKEELSRSELTANAKAGQDAKRAMTLAEKSSAKKAAKATKAKAAQMLEDGGALRTEERVVPVPRANLLSIIEVAGKRTAIFEIGGASLVVEDGESSAIGTVRIKDGRTALVNGVVLSVSPTTLGRFVVSDPKPVDPASQAYKSAQLTGGTPAANPLSTQVPGPSGAIPAGQRSALPPLQLPPGLSVLPAAK